jgi:hypothetical protein
MKTRSLSLNWLIALLVLGAASASHGAPRDAHRAHIRPPKAHSFGHALKELAARWCQRKELFFRQEQAQEMCDYGLSGRVLLLADGFSQSDEFHTNRRECVVPEGAAVFFPIDYALVLSTPDFPLTEAELRARASLYLNYDTNRYCEIDGRPIQNLERYHRQTDVFSFAFGGRGDVPAGTYPAVADGYWMLLAPLSAGTHTIRVITGAPGSDYHVDLLIELTIVPASEYVPPDFGTD